MLTVARAIGGAGTGKTRMMKETAEKALGRPETGGNPMSIGFSSFTRAARSEAAGRCAAAWGMRQSELEHDGWFKTCHSVARKVLQIQKGEIIGNSKQDDVWVSNALGSDVHTTLADEEEGGISVYAGDKVAAAALNYWSLSRSMVVPLRQVVEADQSPEAPSADEVIARIDLYEQAKRLEGRTDFTDLLCRFVGLRNSPKDGPEFVAPEGQVPATVVGWIFDEAQDASKLLDLACRRLVTGEKCKWAWLVGDPYQVLYGWAGASASYFMGWEVAKQKVMPKSYRCAAPILALAERCLQRLGDGYWDRGIAPADHDGRVLESDNFEDDLSDIDPREETLCIARTNRQVKKIAAILHEVGVPFRYVKSKQGSHNKDVGMTGLWNLQHGGGCSKEEWTCAMDLLPSKTSDGQTWLVRGSKAQWERGLSDRFDRLYPEELPEVGVTPALREAIATGKWAGLCDGGTQWYAAAKRYGVDVVANPRVRVGTVHSVKGQEADNVILLTSQGGRTAQAEMDDPERFAEERRVEYVAVTRARRKLIVAHDPREKFRMELPI